MDYEKKYNEALEWMRSLYDGLHGATKEDAEHYFPELKESEDERIRKWIINEIKIKHHNLDENNVDFVDKAIAWLEKQGDKDKLIKELGEYKVKYTQEVLESHLNSMSIKEKAHQIAWETSKHYDPNACKQEWCEMAAIDMATWLKKHIDVKPHIPDESIAYDKEYEEAQKYLSERGFDVPWNDGDVFVDERYITQTVANVLAWGDEHPKQNLEKQSEQILANSAKTCNVEPKFKVGDFIVNDYCIGRIVKITKDAYLLDTKQGIPFSCHSIRLWDITKDAKDGDVLYSLDSKQPFIFKHRKPHEQAAVYCGINIYGKFFVENTNDYIITVDKYIPADKFQRNLLFQKMKEAGYEWNAKKKELKKIEQNNSEESNVGNFDIAGLCYAKAILEKTLGKVEGYQSDDGILEHKSAINAVTKLCEQKSVEIKDAIE